jgi:integrase
MPKRQAPSWPHTITVGNSSLKVYRVAAPRSRTGWSYILTWKEEGRRQRQNFADPAKAILEGKLKAEKLNAGFILGAAMTRDDRDELLAIRQIVGREVPLLSAVTEWARARQLTGGAILQACEAWAARNASAVVPIGLREAVDRFIAEKERAGHEGERTYLAKLDPLVAAIGEAVPLHLVTVAQLTQYLARYTDGVTRNDFRKRAVTLWRWARANGHLPDGAPLAIERTMRAKERPTDIGILGPDTFRRLLAWCRAEHPGSLAALVLAGFCGIRSDEIHGKRADRSIRQTWEDMHLDRRFVRVTVAKQNTPAWRHVPLCPAAVEWLSLTPATERTGPVCDGAALERLRVLARNAGFALPENCLRHSFISYRVELLHDKARVAKEAGNSEREIDRRYRVPVRPTTAREWFAIRPT